DRLDDGAREMIAFAVDGVVRMQAMLDGLLEYSRVGRSGEEPSEVDLNEVLPSGVPALTADDLPRVRAVRTEMARLFRHLVANAVTFGGKNVHISAARDGDAWAVSVADDGIGMDPRFLERVFGIFHRLHAIGT